MIHKIQLKKAISPLRNIRGEVNALLTRVSMGKDISKFKDWDDNFDVSEVEKCIFHFTFYGASDNPLYVKHKCFPCLDGALHRFRGRGRGLKELIDYNKFTRTCLQLGFIEEKQLQNLEDLVFDTLKTKLETASNFNVTFVPMFDEENHLYTLDLYSLAPRIPLQKVLDSAREKFDEEKLRQDLLNTLKEKYPKDYERLASESALAIEKFLIDKERREETQG